MSESQLQNIRQIIQSWRDRAKQLDENSDWGHALAVATALEDCAEQIEILIGQKECATGCLHPNCTCDDYCKADEPYEEPTFRLVDSGA